MKTETLRKLIVIFGILYLIAFGFYITSELNKGFFGWQLEEEQGEGL